MWPWSELALLKRALRLYAGEHVLSRVLDQGASALERSDARVALTLMFVDVAAIHGMSEQSGSEGLTAILDGYLQAGTDCVLAHGGVFDNYVGDGFSAWWHDPMAACESAQQIVRKVAALNRKNAELQLPSISIGIGINTGMVALGNHGSCQRLRFTALGNSVNLASRVCGLANSHYNVPIAITDSTRRLLDGRFETRLLESVHIKGSDGQVSLYELSVR